MAKNNSDPVGTLSIGNVITTSISLYKSNFKRYFQVSLRATGWVLASLLATVGLAVLGGFLFALTNSWMILIPLGLGCIFVLLYFLAKYQTDRAVICRLAYHELIDRPETVSAATQQLQPQAWRFLRLSWLLGLYLSLIIVGSYILLGIAIIGVGVLITAVGGSSNNPLLILLIPLFIVVFLLWIVVIIRYYAYWFIAELPMAIESNKSASSSLRRSRQLSTAAANNIALIVTIAFLITSPINTIGSVPSFIGQIMATPSLSPDQSTQAFGTFLIIAGILLNVLAELFIMPLWQIVKAIVYYDLRNRREGGDLIL